jgi:hypothetical protein
MTTAWLRPWYHQGRDFSLASSMSLEYLNQQVSCITSKLLTWYIDDDTVIYVYGQPTHINTAFVVLVSPNTCRFVVEEHDKTLYKSWIHFSRAQEIGKKFLMKHLDKRRSKL